MSEKTSDDASAANPLVYFDTLTPAGVEVEIETSTEKWHASPPPPPPSPVLPPRAVPTLLNGCRKLVDYSSSSSDEEQDENEKFDVQWGGGKGEAVKTRLQERREREQQPPPMEGVEGDGGGNDPSALPLVPLGDDRGNDPSALPPVPLGDDRGNDPSALPLVPVGDGHDVGDNVSDVGRGNDPSALPLVPVGDGHDVGDNGGDNLDSPLVPLMDPIERGSRDEERRASLDEEGDDGVEPAERRDGDDNSEQFFVIRPAATKIFKKHAAKTFSFTPVNFDETGLAEPPSIDYATQLDNLGRTIIDFIRREMKRQYSRGAKVHLGASVRFRVVRDEEVVDRPIFHFSVKSQLVLHLDEIPVVVGDIIRQLREMIVDRRDRGSNYVFDTITEAQLTICRYKPTKGGFYCRLPISISKKRATLNIDTSGDEETEKRCILYAIVAHLYPVTTNRNRASSYRRNLSRLRYEGVKFPAGRKEIDQLEKLNDRLSINVFSFETLPHDDKSPME